MTAGRRSRSQALLVGSTLPGQYAKVRSCPHGHVEQRFQRQAELNRAIRKPHRPTRTTARLRQPVHLRIKPYFQRSAPLQRCIILRPVRRAIFRCGRFGHDAHLSRSIPSGNPQRQFCNKARQYCPRLSRCGGGSSDQRIPLSVRSLASRGSPGKRGGFLPNVAQTMGENDQ